MKGQPEGSIRTNGTLHQVTRHKAQGARRHEATESSVSLWLRLSMCRDKCDRTELWSLGLRMPFPELAGDSLHTIFQCKLSLLQIDFFNLFCR